MDDGHLLIVLAVVAATLTAAGRDEVSPQLLDPRRRALLELRPTRRGG